MPVTKILTAGIGEVDMRGIDAYRQRGGYKQWERVVGELQPVDVLEPGREIRLARTRRRGLSDRPEVGVLTRG